MLRVRRVKLTMGRLQPEHVIVVGAGAAGLMAARELGRAGKKVTLLEARGRCGGRIYPLPSADFGYSAEGGAEFVHGEAPVTRGLLREAGLSVVPVRGARWSVTKGKFARDQMPDRGADRFYESLSQLKADMSVADFLHRYFRGPEYDRLRHLVVRRVEGYDAADPARASMLALRDEWMSGDRSMQSRIVGGYGALIGFLETDCRGLGISIRFNAAVRTIESDLKGTVVRCASGHIEVGDAVLLTLPLPLLNDIALPVSLRAKIAMTKDLGFGNAIKLLLRFNSPWWASQPGKDLSDLSFLMTDQTIPVWWTQRPLERATLTGWAAGPSTKALYQLNEDRLIQTGLASLGNIFGLLPRQLEQDLVAAKAINWSHDPFALGAYSYATPETREVQSSLAAPDGRTVFLSGEALYRGRDIGTVEAAVASGLESARTILGRRCLF